MLATEDLILTRLPDETTPMHRDARQFCLDVIKEFYGFDYRPDWHADLDALCDSPVRNQYSAANRGAFWVLRGAASGEVVGTAGIKAMRWKPALCATLDDRYPDMERIGSVWRVYVKKDRRSGGIGKAFNRIMEEEARRLGYTHLYLHATATAEATIGFWKASGYTPFGPVGADVYLDKAL